jgi:hypothetical protein
MRITILGLFLLTSVLFFGFSHDASAEIHPGVRLGGYFDSEAFFLGGEILAPITSDWYINPNVEFGFGDNFNIYTFNFDVHYDLPTRAVYTWVGGGPAVILVDPEGNRDGDTDFGLNLLFGVGFKIDSRIVPYIQPKVILSDNSEFVLAFGVRF